MANLLSKPTIIGTQRVSPLYQVMSVGLTTPVMLIGHANATMEPYQVTDMQKAINYLGADYNSPLLRGLLEVYNAGCKDIWLFPAAPMNEYEDVPASRLTESNNISFYERYYDRLEYAYGLMLESFDSKGIVVPLEAPFYDSGQYDFLTQLANYCAETFEKTGAVTLGSMGTRVPDYSNPNLASTNYNATTIQEMIDDNRIALLNDKGKFVFITVGEGVFMHPQFGSVYSRSLEATAAALMATTPLDRAISNLNLPSVASTSHLLFTDAQIEALAQAKLNSVYKTARGRRGFSFETKIITDNTAGSDGSDFWSLSQMRVVSTVINKIRDLGWSYIGEPDNGLFREAVKEYLDNLRKGAYIANYSMAINMETPYKAIVEVAITPMFGIRNIMFTVETGPGA